MKKIKNPEETINMTDFDLVQKTISLSEKHFELKIYFDNFIEHFEQIKELISKNEIK